MNKVKIPKALREQLWVRRIGFKFSGKCETPWCENVITVFDFQCGHDVPESKGGATTIENLVAICSRCNLSMSNTYTFKEWKKLSNPLSKWRKFIIWLYDKPSVTKGSGIALKVRSTNQNVKPLT